MITTFANHASLALELANARREAQRMVTFEDRARIARDLHDHVIQQLFAVGMTIQNIRVALDPTSPVGERLDDAVDTIDDAIRQIRTSIFQLQPHSTGMSLRSAVLDVVEEVGEVLGFDPQTDFRGPIDSVSDKALLSDVVAVVREALTNVAKHARASTATVEVAVEGGAMVVRVADDGTGMPEHGRRSGLANLRRRAEERSGELIIEPGPTAGTVLTWVGRLRSA
jgi:signal transduction histidine kinase